MLCHTFLRRENWGPLSASKPIDYEFDLLPKISSYTTLSTTTSFQLISTTVQEHMEVKHTNKQTLLELYAPPVQSS